MTNLERLALLGDKEAQKECTEKGILLPCPFCGSKRVQIRFMGFFTPPQAFKVGYRGECTDCHTVTEAYRTEKEALTHWNTRRTPPIGRCEDCRYRTWFVPGYGCGNFNSPFYAAAQEDVSIMAKPDDYCSYFEPRCEE